MSEPSCRVCDSEIELSCRGNWKAFCLDCAQSDKDSALSYWRDKVDELEDEISNLRASVDEASSSDTSFDPVCCKQCDEQIERSVAGHWKALCSDCASKYQSKSGSQQAHIEALKSKISELEDKEKACCRECSEELELSRSGRWKAYCLDCASEYKATIREKESRILELDARVDELEAELRNKSETSRLQSEVEALEDRIEELEDELETKDRGRRQEISNLQAAIHRKIAKYDALQQVNNRLKEEIEMLNAAIWQSLKDADAHRKTCPATGNEIMFHASEYTDFCVSVGEDVLHVHRAILASRKKWPPGLCCFRSPVFASMLSLPMRESHERLIQIRDMSSSALRQFCFFLYTGHFQDNFDPQELGAELLAAAHKYDISPMVEALEPLVGAKISKESPAESLADFLCSLSISRHGDGEGLS